MRLARSLGTGNAITPGYVCHSPRLGLYALVTGYGRLYCDYHGWGGEFPKTQIMWAKQLEISSADSEMCYWFMSSLDYCKNLIIIDPRASAYATRANLWIQPRPGTDCALALGMMNVIVEEELWDKEFVDNWTFGFDELRERVKDWTPEKVSDICWIPKEHVIEAARMWAIDTPGCIQVGSSLERQANCGHTLRAITCLMGLTGNIERPGSMVSWVLPDTGLIEDFNLELPITDEMKSKIIGGDRFKMGATRTCNPDTMVKKPSSPARRPSRCGSASAGSRSCTWPTPKRSSRPSRRSSSCRTPTSSWAPWPKRPTSCCRPPTGWSWTTSTTCTRAS